MMIVQQRQQLPSLSHHVESRWVDLVTAKPSSTQRRVTPEPPLKPVVVVVENAVVDHKLPQQIETVKVKYTNEFDCLAQD